VAYEPGELKVVALSASNAPAAEAVVRTAGAPAKIELGVDRTEITADGRDLSFVTVSLRDAEGNLCPHADAEVSFAVEGAGRLVAVGNGDASSTESFQEPTRTCFGGMCVAVVGSVHGKTGEAVVSASADGLVGASVKITAR
jgi:beta-galactosidase